MTLHRAVCADCPWSREDEDLVDLTDKMERHQRKEQHHVDLDKAVARDGGEEIEGITGLDKGLDLAEFVDIADEQSRGVEFLEEPQDVDLRLVELSASFLDPDGILRTFSITAQGFDPEDYEHDPEPIADGSGHVCDACGQGFETLTRLRLHEKRDCPERETYDKIDPDSPNSSGQAAEGLLTCRNCDNKNPNADYDQTTTLTGDDLHLIVEFGCRHCGFENENRVVMEGVDRENIDQLPSHLQPDEQPDSEPITDGSGGFAFEDSLEFGRAPTGNVVHLVDFETDSALARGSDNGSDQTLCSIVTDYERAAAPAEAQFCDVCASKARANDVDLEAAAERSKQPVRADGSGGVTTRSDTAFERKQQFYDRINAELQPDVGPVDDDTKCEARCEAEAVYRVPWPHIGGDVAYCGYHLACYRHDQPDIWKQVQAGPFADPDDYVEIGTRFVSIDEIPDEIRNGTYRLVCLDAEGYALYEGKPDDGYVTFLRVDSRLDDIERNTVRQEIVGELIGWYRQNIGWRRLAPEAEEALLE